MAETLRRTISERIIMPVPCAMVSTRVKVSECNQKTDESERERRTGAGVGAWCARANYQAVASASTVMSSQFVVLGFLVYVLRFRVFLVLHHESVYY